MLLGLLQHEMMSHRSIGPVLDEPSILLDSSGHDIVRIDRIVMRRLATCVPICQQSSPMMTVVVVFPGGVGGWTTLTTGSSSISLASPTGEDE